MPRRKNLSERQVHSLPREDKPYRVPDPQLMGHYLSVPAKGSRAPIRYQIVAPLGRGGPQKWRATGANSQTHRLEEARDIARGKLRSLRAGIDPSKKEAGPRSVASICDQWFELVVVKEGFRSAPERQRIIGKYIKPHIGDMPATAVKRSHVVTLLDKIAADHGTSTASQAKKVLSAAMNWYAKRVDDFSASAFSGHGIAEQERERILSDDEIRRLWNVADQHGVAGDFLKFALLCGQRHQKIATLRWDDLDGDIWHMRRTEREKGVGGSLKLPPLALDILQRQPRIVGQDTVFGAIHYRAIAKLRSDCGFAQAFTPHDLRRTFRSLLSRLQVTTEVSEALMGHQATGVVKIYDRWHRAPEKGGALAKLAQLIQQIVEPSSNKVLTFGAVS